MKCVPVSAAAVVPVVDVLACRVVAVPVVKPVEVVPVPVAVKVVAVAVRVLVAHRNRSDRISTTDTFLITINNYLTRATSFSSPFFVARSDD